MKILLMVLLSFALPGTAVFAQEGYVQLPNASERSALSSEYKAIPSLHLEIVRDGTGGLPDQRLAANVKDANLQKEINEGYFLSLQVRDLSIEPSRVNLDVTTQVIHVPFIVSVKHTQNVNVPIWMDPDQGTIEVAGEFAVVATKDNLSVSVSKFYDSSFAERMGRKLWFNRDINLDFAREVAQPELEAYFNGNPNEIKDMVTSLMSDGAWPPAKSITRVPPQP